MIKRIMSIKFLAKTVSLVLVLSVSACATTKPQALVNTAKKGYIALPPHLERDKKQAHKKYKIGKTYKIKGKAYTPYENFDHVEVGMASWYGPGFHGKKTAIGTRYNMHALTCAHRTLQMPCKVKVTNLSNGKSVELTVNDRGPFAHSRVLDVSREAAKRLGFIHKGHTKVKIQVIKEPSLKLAGISKRRGVRAPRAVKPAEIQTIQVASQNLAEKQPEFQLANMKNIPKKAPLKFQLASVKPAPRKVETSRTLYIQAGQFTNYKGASMLSKKLSKYAPAYVASTEIKGKNHYRVRVGPFKSSNHAKSIMAQMTQKDCGDAKILQVG